MSRKNASWTTHKIARLRECYPVMSKEKLVLEFAPHPIIFIECDGNEFHTKPEQVTRDRARDAEIAAAGIKVLRFTGSEIFADADQCASDVYGEAML